MRNEIFKKIQKNKEQYYAELNQNSTFKKESGETEKLILPSASPSKPEDIKTQAALFSIDREKMKQKWDERSNLLQAGLLKLFKPVSAGISNANSKMTSRSQKISDNIYDFSSRLFEDRFRKVEMQNIQNNNAVNSLAAVRQLEWCINDDISTNSTDIVSIHNWFKTMKHLAKRKIRDFYHKTVLFFEFDPGIIAMNEELKYAVPEIEAKEIYIIPNDELDNDEGLGNPLIKRNTTKTINSPFFAVIKPLLIATRIKLKIVSRIRLFVPFSKRFNQIL